MSTSSQLRAALWSASLIQFSTRFEPGRTIGYVLDVGPQFFLLALVCDQIRFDGFECCRVTDVRGIKPCPYPGFIETALRRRRQQVKRKPRVQVGSIQSLLLSAGRAFPLVTIHRERVDPDVCEIGTILGVSRGGVSMLEIGPDAIWYEQPTTYRLNEVTRVNFGADYEDALLLVGGKPPKVRLQSKRSVRRAASPQESRARRSSASAGRRMTDTR